MLRIVGGTFGGRRITAPPGRQTRPTAERVREGLFNVLQAQTSLEGMRVLDGFAGSGALGIEALSRGAAAALFIESHGPTAALIRRNLKQLGISPRAGRVVVARMESWLARPPRDAPVGLVLLDPPYDHGDHAALLSALAQAPHVAPGAWIVLETARGTLPALPPGLDPVQTKRYGDTQVGFYRKHDT